MEEEITEITVVEGRPKKRSSFWANFFVLSALVAIILWAQQWAVQKAPQTVPAGTVPAEEEIDKHIVLEDLENEKPLPEEKEETQDNGLRLPAGQAGTTDYGQKTKNSIPKAESPPPQKSQRASRKPKAVKKIKSVSVEPDPYTDGGVQDLDRPENWQNYFPGRPKEGYVKEKVPTTSTEATATPVVPQKKEEFIPFE